MKIYPKTKQIGDIADASNSFMIANNAYKEAYECLAEAYTLMPDNSLVSSFSNLF